MLLYEPSSKPWAITQSPVTVLTDLVLAVRAMDPFLWDRLIRACETLDLPLSEAIARAVLGLRDGPPLEPFQPRPARFQMLAEGGLDIEGEKTPVEVIFVACRDALTSDATLACFEECLASSHRLRSTLKAAVARLEVGADPREPW